MMQPQTVQGQRGFNTGLVGERGLVAAVLYRALVDLEETDLEIQKSALHFFRCKEIAPFSFLWICQHLDLDAGVLLRELEAVDLLSYRSFSGCSSPVWYFRQPSLAMRLERSGGS